MKRPKKYVIVSDPTARPASGSSPPVKRRPTPVVPQYNPDWTKAERQPWLNQVRPIIRKAIEDTYRKCPVLHVKEIDAIARKAVEKATGTPVDEFNRIGSGRQRNDNLADWVKSQHTEFGRTIAARIGDVDG